MADDIDAAFNKIADVVYERSGEVEWRTAVKFIKKARRIVDGSTDDFYTMLASRMDVEEAPGELGTNWSPLTKHWLRYKHYVRMGRPRKGGRTLLELVKAEDAAGWAQHFYYGLGPLAGGSGDRAHLKTVLSHKNIENTLGKPVVMVDQEGEEDSEVFLTRNKENAVPRVRGKHTGKFVETHGLVLDINLLVYLAPNVEQGPGGQKKIHDYIGLLAEGNEFLAKKMGSLEARRPLFRPYFTWYMNQKKPKIEAKLMKGMTL